MSLTNIVPPIISFSLFLTILSDTYKKYIKLITKLHVQKNRLQKIVGAGVWEEEHKNIQSSAFG